MRRAAGTAGVLLAALLTASAAVRAAEAPVPRPKPHPPHAVVALPPRAKPARPPAPAGPVQIEDTTEATAEAICREGLAATGIAAEPGAPIGGEGNCRIAAPLTVRAIGEVALEPAAMVNCRTARALAAWLDGFVRPAAEETLGTRPVGLHIAASYVCRGRNGRPGAKLSEHAFGNAVDVSAVALGDGRVLHPHGFETGDADPMAAFQAAIRAGACRVFTTVLGPGADASHPDHFHLDLRRRAGGTRLCE